MFKADSKLVRSFFYSVRLALASSCAIYAAHLMGLQFDTQAGVICLFSMLSTRRDTIELSFARIISFIVTAVTAWFVFKYMGSEWVAFGIYILITVLFSEMMGWAAALSANVVAGCHFLSVQDFSEVVILNEFFIVLTGIVFAVIFNSIHNAEGEKAGLIRDMESVQEKMVDALEGMAEYLSSNGVSDDVWDLLARLHIRLDECIHRATKYDGNVLGSETDYYYQYFEMRKSQCTILENLHAEMDKIRYQPRQAHIISEFIYHVSGALTEKNDPQKQINYLLEIFDRMANDPLPTSREEFESRAVLYHILMDLEEFLLVKKSFLTQREERKSK